MDPSEDQKFQDIDKFSDYHSFLKRTLKFLVSVSMLSLFLCFSPGFSLFPNSFTVYFNSCLERMYMFLICNGILAFLAKGSTSETSLPSVFDLDGQLTSDLFVSKEAIVDEEVPEMASVIESQDEGQKQEHKAGEDIVAEEEEEEEEEEESVPLMVQEEAETGGANDELASTEELNRRIEEFIRKMKEEIRIEARQHQLIAV